MFYLGRDLQRYKWPGSRKPPIRELPYNKTISLIFQPRKGNPSLWLHSRGDPRSTEYHGGRLLAGKTPHAMKSVLLVPSCWSYRTGAFHAYRSRITIREHGCRSMGCHSDGLSVGWEVLETDAGWVGTFGRLCDDLRGKRIDFGRKPVFWVAVDKSTDALRLPGKEHRSCGMHRPLLEPEDGHMACFVGSY